MLSRVPLAVEPLAIGVMSNEGEERGHEEIENCAFRQIHADKCAKTKRERRGSPVSVGELRDVGEPGTGISNAHRKPLTDSRTFWLS